jgi:hypothetical protein
MVAVRNANTNVRIMAMATSSGYYQVKDMKPTTYEVPAIAYSLQALVNPGVSSLPSPPVLKERVMPSKLFPVQKRPLSSIELRQLIRLLRIVPVMILLAFGLHSVAQTPPPAALQVSAGGSANGSWSADEYFSGGNVSTGSTTTVNTLFDPRPAPQSVYQHDRFGAMTYTMSGLTAGASYTVNLHFAETSFTAVGSREFNVLINGTQVLTNFDIFAATGGENMAILKSFPATANSSGQIVVQFTVGADNNPQINGIEILPASPLFTCGGIYTLTSKTSGLNLDNEGSHTASNEVWQWSGGAGNSNQQWQINLLPNGYYNLINLSSGMALDNGGSTTAGTWHQWGVESGNANQEWLITPVQIGANTPFRSYEAESGTPSGGTSSGMRRRSLSAARI